MNGLNDGENSYTDMNSGKVKAENSRESLQTSERTRKNSNKSNKILENKEKFLAKNSQTENYSGKSREFQRNKYKMKPKSLNIVNGIKIIDVAAPSISVVYSMNVINSLMPKIRYFSAF